MLSARERKQVFGEKLDSFCRRWDNANGRQRINILRQFVAQFSSSNVPQIEEVIGAGASLLFTRITSSLRLSYSLGSSVSAHLDAIRLFIRSSHGSRFLQEFMAIGGLLNLADLISQQGSVKESDKASAFELLRVIARTNYDSRICVCKTNIVKLTKKAMLASNGIETQRRACELLGEIGKGGDVYGAASQAAMVSLIKGNTSTSCKHLVLQALRGTIVGGDVHPSAFQLNANFVETIVNLFAIDSIDIHYEATQLLKFIALDRPKLELNNTIVTSLVRILNSALDKNSRSADDSEQQQSSWPSGENASQKRKFAALSTQACAARTLDDLAKNVPNLPSLIVESGAIRGLVHCFCDFKSYESQQIANKLLHLLHDRVEQCSAELQYYMGDEIFDAFVSKKQGGRLFQAFTSSNMAVVQERLQHTREIYMKTLVHENDSFSSATSRKHSTVSMQSLEAIDVENGNFSQGTGDSDSDQVNSETVKSSDDEYIENVAEDIQKSQQAIQKIHRRMALMSRKQRKLDSVSFEPENGTEESEVKVSALKSSHVVAGEESNPEQKELGFAPIRRRLTIQAVRQTEFIDSLKSLEIGNSPPTSTDGESAFKTTSQSNERAAKSMNRAHGASSLTNAARKRLTTRVSKFNESAAKAKISFDRQQVKERIEETDTNDIFVPIAIPSIAAGTILFAQRAAAESTEEQLPSAEVMLQTYGEFRQRPIANAKK